MGNSLKCFNPKPKDVHRRDNLKNTAASPRRRSTAGLTEKERKKMNNDLVRQQAMEAMLLFKQHHNGNLPFDRSNSVQEFHHVVPSNKKKIPRSSSSRPRTSTDSPLQPLQIPPHDGANESVETKHFVLVHGGGLGAWCWYKTIALLQQDGFEVDAVDLTGSGIQTSNSNSVLSLDQYANPLIDFLRNLKDGKKVILVGHDLGGVCISYAMERFGSKISKAVFLAAAMLGSGQSALDMFAHQASKESLMQRARVFIYGDGEEKPPTAIDLDKGFLKDMLFNQSPAKDVALASVSMRPIPFGPVMEKLTLSETGYGLVRRFYVKTQEDYTIPLALQEAMVVSDPPEEVFQLRGSDHSPFFSKPQALHRLLLEIAKIREKQEQLVPARKSCVL